MCWKIAFTCQQLDEYRGFRHVVPNVYTFHLDPEKVVKLVQRLAPVFDQASVELMAFIHFFEINGN
jgi:hypothetical protein